MPLTAAEVEVWSAQVSTEELRTLHAVVGRILEARRQLDPGLGILVQDRGAVSWVRGVVNGLGGATSAQILAISPYTEAVTMGALVRLQRDGTIRGDMLRDGVPYYEPIRAAQSVPSPSPEATPPPLGFESVRSVLRAVSHNHGLTLTQLNDLVSWDTDSIQSALMGLQRAGLIQLTTGMLYRASSHLEWQRYIVATIRRSAVGMTPSEVLEQSPFGVETVEALIGQLRESGRLNERGGVLWAEQDPLTVQHDIWDLVRQRTAVGASLSHVLAHSPYGAAPTQSTVEQLLAIGRLTERDGLLYARSEDADAVQGATWFDIDRYVLGILMRSHPAGATFAEIDALSSYSHASTLRSVERLVARGDVVLAGTLYRAVMGTDRVPVEAAPVGAPASAPTQQLSALDHLLADD